MANGDDRLITRATSTEPDEISKIDHGNLTTLSLSEVSDAEGSSRLSRPDKKSLRESSNPAEAPGGRRNSRSKSRGTSRNRNTQPSPNGHDQVTASESTSTQDQTANSGFELPSEVSENEELIRSNTEEAVPVGAPVSRFELLEIVRKHAHIIQRKRTVSFADESEAEFEQIMEPRYWREMFDLFFVKGTGSSDSGERFPSQDSPEPVLYFVRETANEGGEESAKAVPFFARRWNRQFLRGMRDELPFVDWRKSFFLNLICQTVFTLTVAVCSRKELEAHRTNPKMPAVVPLQKTTKKVFATPNISLFEDKSDLPGEGEESFSYPNISFSLFDNDSFDPMELFDPEQCLCVLLNATEGAAFPQGGRQPAHRPHTGGGSSSPTFRHRRRSRAKLLLDITGESPRVTLFSGFVSYAMVRGNFNAFWGSESERILMSGPGGKGEADVIIFYTNVKQPEAGVGSRLGQLKSSLVKAQAELSQFMAEHNQQLKSAAEREGQDGPDLSLYGPKVSALSEKLDRLETQIKDMGSSNGTSGHGDDAGKEAGARAESMAGGLTGFVRRAVSPPLSCLLRSLSLPWEVLAHDLLFKSAPIKVDITGHIFPRLPDRKYS